MDVTKMLRLHCSNISQKCHANGLKKKTAAILKLIFFLTFYIHTMKIQHTLLASALLAAMSAQAQTSATVYGNADIAYNNLITTATTGIKTEDNNIINGGLSTSYLGFIGDREIAPGLKATFQYEFEVDPTTNAGIAKTRVGLVGLTGNLGAVTFGRRTTLVKFAIDANDAGVGVNTIGFLGDNARDSRRDDMMTFTTASVAGFTADLQVSFGATPRVTSATGAVTNDGKSLDANSVGLNYANGPLTLKWVNESMKNYGAAVTVAGTSLGAPASTSAASPSRKNSSIGGTYDLGFVKLFYVDTKMEQGIATAKSTFDTQTVGLRVPMGSFTFVAESGTGKALLLTSATKVDMKGMQLSGLYTLAKDTTLYVIYGTESASHPTFTAKADQKNTQFGLRYKF
jgi:predicted porin